MLRYSKFFIRSVLLFTIPPFAVYPHSEAPMMNISHQVANGVDISPPMHNGHFFTYDDVLDLLEELEDGNLEERCSTEELVRINHLIALLAKEGLLPNEVNEEFILENDIRELLQEETNPYEYSFSLNQGNAHVIVPSVFYGQGDVILCKSWVQKKWDQTKKFVKKHKKAIIIGAAVVVAVTIVVIAVAATSAGAAAAAAAGAAGVGTSSSPDNGKSEPAQEKKEVAPSASPPPGQPETPPVLSAAQESPNLKAVLDEHISSFKEMVVEDKLFQTPNSYSNNQNESSFGERARDLGAFLAHETLDGVSQLASCVPQLLEEIKEIGELIIPDRLFATDSGPEIAPAENYEKLVATGHQKIDQAFSTDQATRYTPEAKANSSMNDFAIGLIPPPGLLGTGSATMGTGRLAATEVSSVRGWSVGQPINNRTIFGTVPKWSTVRRRYWKNQAEWAKSNPHNYSSEQLKRMEQGLAPQRLNVNGQLESKELHHMPTQKDGGLFDVVEVWPDEHAAIDPSRYLGG